MNKSKGPLLLTEHGFKNEVIDIENQVNREDIVVEKITIDDVNNQIIMTIQNILEMNQNIENIDSLMSYLKLFGFDINEHISLDEKNINNDKITYKYSINKDGEKVIKSVLIYQESKRIIEQKLDSGINFTGLNKKLNYINQNYDKNINISDIYTKEELKNIQDIVINIPNSENLLVQISDLITKIDKQEEYKSRLELINQVIISVNFDNISQDDLSNSSNDTNQNIEDTFSLYKAILAEAKQTVKSNFDTISYSYTEENIEYIEKEKKNKEKIELKKQEKINHQLEESENILKKEKNNKIRKNTILVGIFSVLISGGIILNEKYGKTDIKPIKELTGSNIKQYANKLYDELILKENINIRNTIKEKLDIKMQEVLKFNLHDYNTGLIAQITNSILNEVGLNNLGINIKNENGIVNIIFTNKGIDLEPIKYSVSINNSTKINTQFDNPQLYYDIENKLKLLGMISPTKDDFTKELDSNLGNIYIEHFGKDYIQHIKMVYTIHGRDINIEISDSLNKVIYSNLNYILPAHLI